MTLTKKDYNEIYELNKKFNLEKKLFYLDDYKHNKNKYDKEDKEV